MNDLRDLLRFDVRHLYSAEEQIIEALPAMISKANDPQLKQALEQHLRVTEQQRDRLDQVKQLLGGEDDDNDGGIFSGLFGTGSKSKGIAGLIDEGQKVMGVDMAPAVLDAAIIGCAQKIEHYEIAGYGTARTYAEQLGLTDVAQLLQQTLIEEHDADDLLTSLAVRDINLRAEAGADINRNSTETYR
ncbi:MAG: ferritin-like domain-containing protein [Flavisolibacter sp.]|nr:ferritin-like domain-containing protein [Flavisolibacter sp.]